MSIRKCKEDFVFEEKDLIEGAKNTDHRNHSDTGGGVLTFESQQDNGLHTPNKPSLIHNQLSTSHKDDPQDLANTAQP